MISSAERKKFLVASPLDDLSVRKHENNIRMSYRGKPVCHDKHRADTAHFVKRILNEDLCFGVDIGGSFVKYHNSRLMHHGARKRKELSLSCGEIVSAFADFLVKTALQLVYKAVGVYVSASIPDFLVRYVIVAKDYV